MQTLVSVDELSLHLEDPNWIIIDCRFELTDPSWGFATYQEFHIPSAIYADLDQDLSAPKTPSTGRHPLPDSAIFRGKLAAWGITPQKQVVVYDTVSGSFAARLWWMLRLYGLPEVAVLDGGIGAWIAKDLPTRSGIELPRQTAELSDIPQPRTDMIATFNEVERIRQDPHYLLLDARSGPRFLGEQEPIDTVAGRIPGAVNRFHTLNLTLDGVLKPTDVLLEEFNQLLGNHSPTEVIVYCGSGVTSCFHLLAMEHIGLHGTRLYPGSWSEWIRDPNRPIAKG